MHQRTRQQLIIKQRIDLGNCQSQRVKTGTQTSMGAFPWKRSTNQHLQARSTLSLFMNLLFVSSDVPFADQTFSSEHMLVCRMEQRRFIRVAAICRVALRKPNHARASSHFNCSCPSFENPSSITERSSSRVFFMSVNENLEYNLVGI